MRTACLILSTLALCLAAGAAVAQAKVCYGIGPEHGNAIGCPEFDFCGLTPGGQPFCVSSKGAHECRGDQGSRTHCPKDWRCAVTGNGAPFCVHPGDHVCRGSQGWAYTAINCPAGRPCGTGPVGRPFCR
jgi:hypothetical protein